MRVAILQPSFFPWRGYFDIIASVDMFIFLDNVQYTRSDWRNRNLIKTKLGTRWLTVPVQRTWPRLPICETLIDYTSPFYIGHIQQFREAYRHAPYLDCAIDLMGEAYRNKYATISELAIATTELTCRLLNISTPRLKASGLGPPGTKTDGLLAILKRVGASTYLSGPSADSYLDKATFASHNIILEYKTYEYRPYPQLWGDFEGQVSILDLVANTGLESREHIMSGPNTVVELPQI